MRHLPNVSDHFVHALDYERLEGSEMNRLLYVLASRTGCLNCSGIINMNL